MSLAFTPTRGVAFDPYPELHSEGQSNLSSYSSPTVDSLVVALRTALDASARGRIYRQLQGAVAADVPTIYTVYVPRTFAHRRELRGARVGQDGPFSSAGEWYLER
jgi:ABC-type transport system substrate-binding protein